MENTLYHIFGKIILNYINDLLHPLKDWLHFLLYILDDCFWLKILVVYLEIFWLKNIFCLQVIFLSIHIKKV